MPRTARTAFTLIEILIVVVVLGIIAAIVIPNVSAAVVQTKKTVLRTLLKQANTQLQVFRYRHGIAPGTDPVTGTWSEATLVLQMTRYVDLEGNTSEVRDGRFMYGPYFDQFPVNPINGRSNVLYVGSDQDIPVVEGVPTTGWIYKPSTLQFCSGVPDAAADMR